MFSFNDRQTFANMDMDSSYKPLFELLWNSQLPCFDVRNVTSKNNNEFGKLSINSNAHMKRTIHLELSF